MVQTVCIAIQLAIIIVGDRKYNRINLLICFFKKNRFFFLFSSLMLCDIVCEKQLNNSKSFLCSCIKFSMKKREEVTTRKIRVPVVHISSLAFSLIYLLFYLIYLLFDVIYILFDLIYGLFPISYSIKYLILFTFYWIEWNFCFSHHIL